MSRIIKRGLLKIGQWIYAVCLPDEWMKAAGPFLARKGHVKSILHAEKTRMSNTFDRKSESQSI